MLKLFIETMLRDSLVQANKPTTTKSHAFHQQANLFPWILLSHPPVVFVLRRFFLRSVFFSYNATQRYCALFLSVSLRSDTFIKYTWLIPLSIRSFFCVFVCIRHFREQKRALQPMINLQLQNFRQEVTKKKTKTKKFSVFFHLRVGPIFNIDGSCIAFGSSVSLFSLH